MTGPVWNSATKLLAGLIAAAVLAAGAAAISRGEPGPAVPAFASEADLRAFLEARSQALARLRERRSNESVEMFAMVAPAAEATADASASADAITNTQEAGVDEGGLVKARGDLLVVLRRGRLFTLSTAGGGMRAVDRIDAFPPGADARHAWYDEMVLVGDRVVVIGYHYGRDFDEGATQIVRFRLAADGGLSFEDACQLRSFDYYSSENFASRLIGDTLVLYAPLPLLSEDPEAEGFDPFRVLPGMRTWRPGSDQPFTAIARPTDIHIAPHVRSDPLDADTLHSVSRCDLDSTPMRCRATGVIASRSRSFYVSPEALYLWTAAYPEYGLMDTPRSAPPASVFRLPFDGAAPTAIQARGAPIDQFSFRERDGVLNVVVQSEGLGDAMWAGPWARGSTQLVRLPLDRFGDGSRVARDADYRALPEVPDEGWNRQNRFVGDHVLISASGGGDSEGGVLVVAPVRGGAATRLDFDREVTRIESLGQDALAVTSGEGTRLNLIRLDGRPRVGARLEIGGEGEAESRSHGFFFRATPGSGGQRGLMALPVLRALSEGADQWIGQAVDMIFVRRDRSGLSRAGAVGGRVGQVDDGCVVSCIDWYGDARPIFLGDRVFALLGYELVEGRERDGRVVEVARLDFSPPAQPRD